MENEEGSPTPEKFRSLPGCVFPLYHVLADVSEFAGGEVLPSSSNTPLAVDGVVLRKDGRLRVLLVNLTGQERKVRVTGAGLPKLLLVKSLDESCAETAMISPESFRKQPGNKLETGRDAIEIWIRPYATMRLDQAHA